MTYQDRGDTLERVSYELNRLGKSFFFPVGIPVQLEIEGVTLRMKSFSVGYLPDAYLIVKYPYSPISISTMLTKGKKVNVRYIDKGVAFAFQSELIAVVEETPNLLLISYPRHIVRQSLRGARRIDCFLPATIFKQDPQDQAETPLGDGIIADISGTGCGFVVLAAREGEAMARLRLGDDVALLSKLPGTEDDIRLPATVKRVQRDSENTNIGLHFKDIEENQKAKLAEFISTLEKFASEMR